MVARRATVIPHPSSLVLRARRWRARLLNGMHRDDEHLLIIVEGELLVDMRESFIPGTGLRDNVGRGTTYRLKLEEIRHFVLPE